MHFHRASSLCKAAIAAQALYQKEAAPAALLQMLWAGRVGHLVRVKARPFVRYAYRERVLLLAKRNGNAFARVASIAVHHGIGNRFGQTNENIIAQIGRKIQPACEILYKRFHLAHILWVRRKSQVLV